MSARRSGPMTSSISREPIISPHDDYLKRTESRCASFSRVTATGKLISKQPARHLLAVAEQALTRQKLGRVVAMHVND